MGRKSNLRKKFAKLKLRQESVEEQKHDVHVSPSLGSNAESTSEEFGDDRLTCLPDKILSNILSRLESSEAVRTSVLSKSWVNKWTSITKLNCSDGFPLPNQHFMDGLESVIPKVSCMKHFSLNCFHMHDPSRLRSLVFTALRSYPLVALDVSMISAPCSFCLCAFKKNSLTKLVLSGNISLTFPADASFTHLKSIRLCDVTLKNFHQSSSVILGVPVLEDFEMIKCKLWNVESLEIVSPLLSKLKVIRCTYLTLTGFATHCVFEISGGSNIDFTYAGSYAEDFVFRNSTNVTTSNMKLCLTAVCDCCLQVLEGMASNAHLLLEKFHTSLEMLEITQNVAMVLANTGGPSYPLPVFMNLKYVRIPMLWCFTCPDVMNNVAVEVLKNAPFLQELTISEVSPYKKCKKGKRRDSKQKRGNILPAVGNFIMVNLKSLIFESFNRWVDEVELVRIFLAKAPVLEEVSIPVNCMAVAKKLEKHLSAFPKASANASLVFRVRV